MKQMRKSIQHEEDDWPPPTKSQRAELDRRLADFDDPTRYVIVSPFSKRFCLYYQIGDGTFIMNEIPDEVLFKRRGEAEAVARVVESRKRNGLRRSLQVIAVRKTKKGVRILEKVRSIWDKGGSWKPILRRRDTRTSAQESRSEGMNNQKPGRSKRHEL